MSAASFRYSAGCCCCASFFTLNNSGGLSLYRNTGTYPNNKISRVALGPVSVNKFAVDWRNEFVFYSVLATMGIYRNTLTLSKHEFVANYDAPLAGSGTSLGLRQTGGLACDWLNQKLYYSTAVSTDGAPFPATAPIEVHQIRRMNYDGTNDEQILTQEWHAASSPTIPARSQTRIRILPQLNLIFFWINTECGIAGTPPAYSQSNLIIRLFSCDLDGGGLTELYSKSDLTKIAARYSLLGFDVLANRNKLIWTDYHDGGLDNTDPPGPNTVNPREVRTYLTDLDGSNSQTILSSDYPPTGSSETEYNEAYSEKTGHVYYSGFRVSPPSPTGKRYKIKRFHIDDAIDTTGNSHEVLLDGSQGGSIAGGIVAGGVLPFQEMNLGCALENTRISWSGAS